MTIIQRVVYKELKNHLSQPEISLVLGPRQAGKTTLLKLFQHEVEDQGKKTIFFDLDLIEHKQYFSSQHQLLGRIQSQLGKSKAVVFIDEIQRLENAGLFLKGLYDLARDYKLIVSGSGSLELKANILEPLTGRKRIFFCLPLSFAEFVAFRCQLSLDFSWTKFVHNPFELERLRQEYFIFGGYPRVLLASTEIEKRTILTEIFQSYLEKDIQLLLGVENSQAFSLLVKLLADQIGQLVNRAKLAATCGISEKTVEKYLYFLEKTFVISLVRPFYRNARKELRKSPKAYFLDLGFLNLARGLAEEARPSGSVLENACFLQLYRPSALEPVRYWRSMAGAEVDFVVSTFKGLLPIEVKSQPPGKTLGRGLISFIQKYCPGQVIIATPTAKQNLVRFTTPISYIPYHLLSDLV